MSEKAKPAHLDKKAKMKYNQWHKGKLYRKKRPIGRYTIWDVETTLLHDGEYTREGKIIWFTSYHPNEIIGREVTYDELTNTTKVVYRSCDNPASSLITPLRDAEKGYAQKVYEGQLPYDFSDLFNGSPEGVSFFTEEGVLISIYTKENYDQLVRQYFETNKGEKWAAALLRLNNYWTALEAQLKKDNISYDDYFSVHFTKPVSETEIGKAEERLGFLFPESYKSFITQKGLLSFGNIRDNEGKLTQRMLHPNEMNTIENLLDEDNTGDFEEYYQLPKEKRVKIIAFFKDQEDIQYEGWIAFDGTDESQNECGVIDNIGCKNIAEWEKTVTKKVEEASSAMDRFVSVYVNRLIKP